MISKECFDAKRNDPFASKTKRPLCVMKGVQEFLNAVSSKSHFLTPSIVNSLCSQIVLLQVFHSLRKKNQGTVYRNL